ncbi:hypothetical protein OE88DRAFT_1644107 [Heliocybe sulcata]|uniref:Uncharacterized protein n=1 Tax=Heliocybe sulcata TaxID=5364 RepID=A0A5C3NFW3_9AGAM|nr:hypothetical protein OE88DRAFT_1644107 [Heliocybe sulcata]
MNIKARLKEMAGIEGYRWRGESKEHGAVEDSGERRWLSEHRGESRWMKRSGSAFVRSLPQRLKEWTPYAAASVWTSAFDKGRSAVHEASSCLLAEQSRNIETSNECTKAVAQTENFALKREAALLQSQEKSKILKECVDAAATKRVWCKERRRASLTWTKAVELIDNFALKRDTRSYQAYGPTACWNERLPGFEGLNEGIGEQGARSGRGKVQRRVGATERERPPTRRISIKERTGMLKVDATATKRVFVRSGHCYLADLGEGSRRG